MAQKLDPQQLLAIAIGLVKVKAEEIITGLVGKITQGKRILKFRSEKDREIAELKTALAQTNENLARLASTVEAHLTDNHEALEAICKECEEGSQISLEQE